MAETSPDGRFRFVKEASGPPTAGTAYDTENGLLVGWNVLDFRRMSNEEGAAVRQSVDLLKRLDHSHVLGVHSSWDVPTVGTEQRRLLPWQVVGGRWEGTGLGEVRQSEGGKLVYLTTPCTTLEAFMQNKVEFLRWRVVKRWCRQVLDALSFLHRQPTPIVHKTLNLGNVYIDPSKSHLFVGGVKDIVAPTPSPSTAPRPTPPQHRSTGSSGGSTSWGGRAWGLVSGTGSGGGSAVASAPSAVARDGKGRTAGARDVRAFGTLLIEMILKKRLDPSLAQDDPWVEMLLAVSGWPATVIDFIGLCKAPVDERPSADELLEHPFLELGNALDDEPINNYLDLVATTQAMVAAAAAGTTTSFTLPIPDSRGSSPPPPLFAPLRGGVAGAAAYSGSDSHQSTAGACPYFNGTTPTVAGGSKPSQHPSSCPGCRGAGGWATCSWSSDYAPSCVSTESPSPSSPSTAPSFGGVPTTPSPPPTCGLPGIDLGWVGSAYSRESASTATCSDGRGSVGSTVSAAGMGSFVASDGTEQFVPPGVTPATLAIATAMAAQIHAASLVNSGGGRDARGNLYQDRIRAVSCAVPSSVGQAESRAAAGNVEGGGATRSRSASEDAVWDMLPSDERECRRPFTCSAVEHRHR